MTSLDTSTADLRRVFSALMDDFGYSSNMLKLCVNQVSLCDGHPTLRYHLSLNTTSYSACITSVAETVGPHSIFPVKSSSVPATASSSFFVPGLHIFRSLLDMPLGAFVTDLASGPQAVSPFELIYRKVGLL
jgi:hypothetical protein